jgi:ParB/RepB/Spo0J family partition protein
MITVQDALHDADKIVELELQALESPVPLLRPVSDELVSELARSIEGIGLLQPIVVRRSKGRYEVVFGNHRLEACKRLGIERVPVVIKPFTEDEAFLARVSENLLRNASIDPIEEAEGYKRLVANGWTINAIGSRIGKCDSYVCERLALLGRLSRSIRSKVSTGCLTPSHAELLSRIKDPTKQTEVAELVEKKRLSVRALEEMLNARDVPLPKRVPLVSSGGECVLHIPKEFAEGAGLNNAQSAYMYLHGTKLIIDSLEFSKVRRKRTNACTHHQLLSVNRNQHIS